MLKPILLRPHHLLCLQFFAGKGYSAEFVENMGEVKSMLDGDPRAEVTLCSGADDICRRCPNRVGFGCGADPKPPVYDRSCLCACGLKIGDTLPWQNLKTVVRSRILISHAAFSAVCSSCSWFPVCAPAGSSSRP